jgi:hypothetical protein
VAIVSPDTVEVRPRLTQARERIHVDRFGVAERGSMLHLSVATGGARL